MASLPDNKSESDFIHAIDQYRRLPQSQQRHWVDGSFMEETYSRTKPSLETMLMMRLRTEGREFQRVVCHQCSPELVAVFIVYNNKPIIIEDDGNLFPSDSLVTKIRLLVG